MSGSIGFWRTGGIRLRKTKLVPRAHRQAPPSRSQWQSRLTYAKSALRQRKRTALTGLPNVVGCYDTPKYPYRTARDNANPAKPFLNKDLMRGQALAFALTMLNCWFYVIRRFHHRTFALLLVLAAALPLCAQNEAAAKVVSLSGQVSILRDGSTWALNAGDLVKPQQTIITGADSFATFKVSDGSTFDVFPNAQVIFRNNPGDWKDLLEIMLGKVKVQIQHFGGQPNHNKVRTPTAGDCGPRHCFRC